MPKNRVPLDAVFYLYFDVVNKIESEMVKSTLFHFQSFRKPIMLELTHTLPVNTAHKPQLTLEQLWTGLLLRVIEPTRFTVGLDEAKILEQSETHFRRVLSFGEHQVSDVVKVSPQQSLEFITDATETAPSGRLLIEVQGQEPADLRLKFAYTTQFPEPSSDEERGLLEMIKNAYMAADMDMLRIIREYAQMSLH